jgi:hypothetical protein
MLALARICDIKTLTAFGRILIEHMSLSVYIRHQADLFDEPRLQRRAKTLVSTSVTTEKKESTHVSSLKASRRACFNGPVCRCAHIDRQGTSSRVVADAWSEQQHVEGDIKDNKLVTS